MPKSCNKYRYSLPNFPLTDFKQYTVSFLDCLGGFHAAFKLPQDRLQSCKSNHGFWWYPVNEEKSSTLSPVKLFVAISFDTLMTKHLYFSILNSFHGKRNAALGRKRFLSGHLQSCGCDCGWSNVTGTPDTLCGRPGWKTNGVPVIFTNVYC